MSSLVLCSQMLHEHSLKCPTCVKELGVSVSYIARTMQEDVSIVDDDSNRVVEIFEYHFRFEAMKNEVASLPYCSTCSENIESGEFAHPVMCRGHRDQESDDVIEWLYNRKTNSIQLYF